MTTNQSRKKNFRLKGLIIFVILILISVAIKGFFWSQRHSNSPQKPANQTFPTEQNTFPEKTQQSVENSLPQKDAKLTDNNNTAFSNDARSYVVERLIRNGYEQETAEAVFQVNASYFSGLYDTDTDLLDEELGPMYNLGSAKFQKILTKNPEMASLLASVSEVASDAEIILKPFASLKEEEKILVCSLYQLNAAPENAYRLAKLLQNKTYREKLLAFLRQDVRNMDTTDEFFKAFDYDQECLEKGIPEAADIYREWFFGLIGETIDHPNQTDKNILLITVHAETIRQFLLEKSFREQFLSQYWPWFRELIAPYQTDSEEDIVRLFFYMSDLEIWTFFKNYGHDALVLFREYGEHATAILLLSNFLDSQNVKAQERMIQIMKEADESAKFAIISASIPENPTFVDFLMRDLNDRLYRNAVYSMSNTNQQEQSVAKLLDYWAGLSDSALTKELETHEVSLVEFIPGYDIYNYARKKVDGRETSGTEAIFATLDAVFVVADVATLGGTAVGRNLISAPIKTTGKITAKGTTKAILKEGIKKTSEKIIRMEGTRPALQTIQGVRRFFKDSLKDALNIDISNFVRFIFEKSNIGRESFKKWTSLEARCFMRADRRVIIDFTKIPNTLCGKILKNTMSETAVAAGVVTGANTHTGQAIIRASNQQINAWKSNLSCWWFANNHHNQEKTE